MIWLITEIVSALADGDGGGGGQAKKLVVDQNVLRKSVRRCQSTLRTFDNQRKQDTLKIMRTSMGRLSGDIAMATPPLNGRSIQDAKENIKADINFIFRPLESIPFGELVLAKQWPAVTAYNFNFKSRRLNKAYQDGDWETIHKAFAKNGMGKFKPYNGDDINLTKNPNKVLHKSARNARGQLNGTTFRVTGSKDDAVAKINRYAEAAMAAIGMMVGGWVKCYYMLKGTGLRLPQEYARKGNGMATTVWQPNQIVVQIRNEYGNYGGYFDQRSSYFAFLLDEAAQKARKRYLENCDALMTKYDMK